MGNKNSKSTNFIVQGGILAMAGVIARLIGLIYRVPMQRTIGDAGMGYYSAAFQIYSLMLIISSYSLPVAVSKLIAGYTARDEYKNAKRIYNCSMLFACFTGGITCLIVFFCADFLAGLIKLPKSAIALRILAPTLLVVAIMGVMRGFFQGNGSMVPTATSQLVEQIINAIVSVVAAKFLFDYGLGVSGLLRDDDYAAAYGAAGGTLGTSAGALAGLICLIIVYLISKRDFNYRVRHDENRHSDTFGRMLFALILTVLPVLLSTTVYNLSDILDQGIFNYVMDTKGLSEVKAEHWGIFSTKYKVLTNVPVALASAVCSSMMPSLTGCIRREEYKIARRKVSLAMRFTMILSIPCAVGLAVLGKPIISTLFQGEVDIPATMLKIGSIAVVFYSMSTLSNGVLQGIDKLNIPVRNAAIALVLHVGILYFMLDVFNMGLYGVVISCVLFALIMCILNWLAIRKYLNYQQEIVRTFVIPTVSSIFMGLVAWLSNFLISKALSSFVSLAISIALSVCVYFVLLIKLKGVKEKEIRSFPGGNLMAAIARFFRLL
ncbi:MAG: polysaccharide biosynthesis protein [Lachnospiraceae bacterium]|jgi:stage V sporulation protein B|nr:polysaccharide biosynthesis protein [Lachnospiraceae bacterium]MDY4836645.1 polysaccharide biosynthesis protein [Lachnospiraceae bacterium]MDY5640544.1 polysaccharide biosynthesis protein [Lachnospiraceae bacterium]